MLPSATALRTLRLSNPPFSACGRPPYPSVYHVRGCGRKRESLILVTRCDIRHTRHAIWRWGAAGDPFMSGSTAPEPARTDGLCDQGLSEPQHRSPRVTNAAGPTRAPPRRLLPRRRRHDPWASAGALHREVLAASVKTSRARRSGGGTHRRPARAPPASPLDAPGAPGRRSIALAANTTARPERV